MKRLLALLALLALLPSVAQAWWNSDWKYQRKITLNTTPAGADIKENVAPALVAIRLHSGNFLFTDAKPDGSDIRFVANDDRTPLKFFIESFDATNQLALAWVLLPAVTANSSADYLYMYSGNEKVDAGGEAKDAYEAAQLLALEFGEAAPPFKDNSSYATPVTGDGVEVDHAGILGNAAKFDGKGLLLASTASVHSGTGAGVTVSVWFKSAGSAQKSVLFSWGPMSLQLDADQLQASVGTTRATAASSAAGTWTHAAMVLSDHLSLYVNGAEVATAPASLPELSGEMKVGTDFHGSLDSLQVIGAARTPAAIKLLAVQGNSDRLLSVGEAVSSEEGGSTSYIKILFSSLTLDAKIVIAILAVMFAVAVSVMVTKAIQVSRTDSQNGQFLSGFNERAHEFLDPDHAASAAGEGPALPHSSILPLYQTGMRELRLRVHGARRQLSAESFAAIKASIDSTLIRENQRLNQRMVLLTIAISGGPFLGLLGTVVGVMITFAAIAAQGDVNINAIAPGIAAALLATVAGLAVAIPSLFGYNYLITRIKAITADMQAFADEFICKMAEAQSGI